MCNESYGGRDEAITSATAISPNLPAISKNVKPIILRVVALGVCWCDFLNYFRNLFLIVFSEKAKNGLTY